MSLTLALPLMVMTKTSPLDLMGGKTMTTERSIYDVADDVTPSGHFRVVARHDTNQATYCTHTTWITAWRCAKFGECTRRGNGQGYKKENL